MLPVTPSIIPEPFAEHGAKNVIPEESPGASEPNASWTQGFPPVTMLNRQAGGKPPLGQDFNGILNALSQHLFFTQSGCVYPWMGADKTTGFPGLNYLGGSHVLGSDLKEYIAVHPSGPDVPQTGGGYVGPKDPVTDTQHLYWRPEVTSADIPEFDGVTIKEINGKYGVPEFTSPTASAPGKAGLVPGPRASGFPQNVILTANGFMEVDWAFMHPTAESVQLNKSRMDMGAVTAENVNIDTLLRAGIFTAITFGGTLPSGVRGGLLYNILSMNPMASPRVYYGIQILIGWDGTLYIRSNHGGITPGGTVFWTDWTQKQGGGTSAPGTVFFFGGATAPMGTLPCNGAAVSRTTYANLFAAIGTTWGAGDGSTTFNIPNLAYRVLRGTDFSVYPVGTLQNEGLPNIAGTFGTDSWGGGVYVSGAFYDTGARGGGDDNNGKSQAPRIGFSAQISNGIYGAAAGVQPYGALLLPCIVY